VWTAAELMEIVLPMVTGTCRDKYFIIKMNQSPIPFTFDRQRTLEFVGAGIIPGGLNTKVGKLYIKIMLLKYSMQTNQKL